MSDAAFHESVVRCVFVPISGTWLVLLAFAIYTAKNRLLLFSAVGLVTSTFLIHSIFN